MSFFRNINNRSLLLFVAGFSSAITLTTLYHLLTRPSNTFPIAGTLKRKRVLFFGDSITQHGFNTKINGWVSQFGNWWTRRVDVLNRGYSGYNTKWAKQAIERVVIEEQPDFVFMFFGANDAVDASVLQHVSVNDFRDNLRYMSKLLKQRLPNVPVILITPPPIAESMLEHFNSAKGKPLLVDRTNHRAREYGEVVKEVGHEFDIPVVDAWLALGGASRERADHLSDGLHLSALGCDALFEEAKKVVLKHYPRWNPELMPMQLPQWSEINPNDQQVFIHH